MMPLKSKKVRSRVWFNFLEDALTEFEEAAVWYETNLEGLGERLRNSINNKIKEIQEYPERFIKRKGNFKEAIIKHLPYTIINTFYKKESIMVVNAIFHMS